MTKIPKSSGPDRAQAALPTDLTLGIRPSVAIVATTNDTIGDAVRKMRENNVGSILVMDYENQNKLEGIFTERDLLKWIDEIQHGAHWEKSIATIMTKPVQTITIYEINQAANIMLAHHFRHLPVVYQDGTGMTHVFGVISMRDLFDNFVRQRQDSVVEDLTVPKQVAKKIGFIAKDHHDNALRMIFSQGPKSELHDLSVRELVNPDGMGEIWLNSMDLVVFDMDRHGSEEWGDCLRFINTKSTKPHTIIVFNPVLHSPQNVQLLKKLSRSDKFAAFAKPLNVISILHQIRSWL